MEVRIEKLENKFNELESMFLDWMKGDTNAAIKALDNKLADLSKYVKGNFADINALKKRVAANEKHLKRDSLTDRFFNPDGSVVEGDTTEEDKDPDGSDDEEAVQRSDSLKTFNPSTTTTQLKI